MLVDVQIIAFLGVGKLGHAKFVLKVCFGLVVIEIEKVGFVFFVFDVGEGGFEGVCFEGGGRGFFVVVAHETRDLIVADLGFFGGHHLF